MELLLVNKERRWVCPQLLTIVFVNEDSQNSSGIVTFMTVDQLEWGVKVSWAELF